MLDYLIIFVLFCGFIYLLPSQWLPSPKTEKDEKPAILYDVVYVNLTDPNGVVMYFQVIAHDKEHAKAQARKHPGSRTAFIISISPRNPV